MNRRRGGDTRTHTVSTLTRCVPAECLHFSIFFFSSYSASLRRSLVRYSSSLPSQIPSLLALVHPLSSFIRLLPSVPRCCLSPLPRYSVPETSFADLTTTFCRSAIRIGRCLKTTSEGTFGSLCLACLIPEQLFIYNGTLVFAPPCRAEQIWGQRREAQRLVTFAGGHRLRPSRGVSKVLK